MAQGDQESAELAYNRCGAALAACTGVAPSNETRALLEVSDGLPAAAAGPATAPASPPRGLHPGVRLGVMPLRVLDGTGDDSLSLGLAEEITTALSRFRWISCIASTAMARFAGDGGAGSEPLDLDFLLDGTVQRGRSRVRVNVRLLDVRAGGEVVWAQRFDRDAADLLSLQDEITAETVAQVDPELLLLEGTRASSRPAAGSNAYDLTIRAIPAVYRLDRAGYDLAGEMLAAAVAADPAHAAAHAWWAYWHLFLVGQGWAADPVRAMARAESLAEQAVILDPGDARALTLAGHVRAFLHRRVEEGIALHERALSLNPNLALAWTFLSLAQTYAGRPDEGLEAARQSKRLAPLDPHGFMVDAALMLSHLIRGEHEVVAEIGRRTTGLAPGFTANWKLYLSSLGHLRRMEQSAVVRDQLLRLEPGFTIRAAIERSPLLRAEDRIVYGDGLRLAGLPD